MENLNKVYSIGSFFYINKINLTKIKLLFYFLNFLSCKLLVNAFYHFKLFLLKKNHYKRFKICFR